MKSLIHSLIIAVVTFLVTMGVFWFLVYVGGANLTDYTWDDYVMASWITAAVTAAINFFRTLLEEK